MGQSGNHLDHLSAVRQLEAGVQNPRRRKYVITSRIGKADPTNLFQRSWLQQRKASKNLQGPKPFLVKKPRRFEDVTTLKRVCPSECQGAQGAFKDSMIH
jgi:hypothetical protein